MSQLRLEVQPAGDTSTFAVKGVIFSPCVPLSCCESHALPQQTGLLLLCFNFVCISENLRLPKGTSREKSHTPKAKQSLAEYKINKNRSKKAVYLHWTDFIAMWLQDS